MLDRPLALFARVSWPSREPGPVPVWRHRWRRPSIMPAAVLTVYCDGRSALLAGHRILQYELARAGEEQLGPAAASLTDLDDPQIDWVRLAEGLGVSARRVTNAETLTAALTSALTESGPHLLEAAL